MRSAFMMAAVIGITQAPATERLSFDAKMRPVVAVRINDAASVDMIVDTAAQSSLMTVTLAQTLALPTTGEQVTVNGVGGSMAAQVHAVRRMTTGLFDLRDATLIALPRIGATQAQGIIGLDLFAGRKLVFDLAGRRLSVTASGTAAADHATVKGMIDAKGLLHVPVAIDGTVVDGLVDTGAEGSIANGAVLRALGWRDDDPRLKIGGTIIGATAGSSAVRRGRVGRVALGPVGFGNVPLTFTGPAHGTPRIILGMDMLGMLQRFALDLPRGELQIFVPPRVTPARPAAPRTGS